MFTCCHPAAGIVTLTTEAGTPGAHTLSPNTGEQKKELLRFHTAAVALETHRDPRTPCGEHPMRCPQRPQALLQQLVTFHPADQREDHQRSRVSAVGSVGEGDGVSRRATSGGSFGGGAGRAEKPEGAKVKDEGTGHSLGGHRKEARNSPSLSARPCELSILPRIRLKAK